VRSLRADSGVEMETQSGDWCVWLLEVCPDLDRPLARYATRDEAIAARDSKRADASPDENLLYGYSVRRLVDGKWSTE